MSVPPLRLEKFEYFFDACFDSRLAASFYFPCRQLSRSSRKSARTFPSFALSPAWRPKHVFKFEFSYLIAFVESKFASILFVSYNHKKKQIINAHICVQNGYSVLMKCC